MNRHQALEILCKHAIDSLPSDDMKKEELWRAIATLSPRGKERDDAEQIAFTLAEARRLQLDFRKKLGL